MTTPEAPSAPTPANTGGAPGASGTPPAATPPADPAATPPPATPPATPPAAGQTPPADPATPPAATPPKDPATPPATDFKLPDEYKDKPWAAKVKSVDDLWKQLANTQELVGKKSVVPDLAKATPEEREAYYAQLRPKDVAEYQFPEGVPVDPELQTGVRQLLSKHGISATQGNEIIKGYQEHEQKLLAQQFSPEGFEASMKEAFGDDYKSFQSNVRTELKGMMNENDFKALDNLPNSYLGIIYRTLGNTTKAVQNLMKAYGVKETNLAHFATGGQVAATDPAGIRAQLTDQINKLVAGPHTAAQLKELIDKRAATYTNDPRLQQQT